MTATFRYIKYNGGFDDDLGDVVRLGSGFSFTELAELGAVGTSTVTIDDPDATAGHLGDGILGLQQFAYDDDDATLERVYMGWTGLRSYHRGEDSLREGAARKIDIDLTDGNVLASRWIFDFKADDPDVNRPEETAAARIAYLLGSPYFDFVFDNGLVNPASVTLDPNDYSTQTPADLLNDCCTANGDNWFIYWDRDADAWSLAVFNFTTYSEYTASLILSNDLAVVDSDIRDGAGPSNTWAVLRDAVMTSDPGNVTTRVLLPYAKGSVLIAGTSLIYPHVDHQAPTTSVKTVAAATAKANRYLADNATEAHRITCSAKIAAANVNDALPGQLIIASFTHLPPYDVASYFRIARRTVTQVETTDAFYLNTYELVPVSPVYPTSTFAVLDRGYVSSAGPIDSPAIGTYEMGYSGTGDVPPGGGSWIAQPKSGLVDYLYGGAGGVIPIGFTALGDGDVTVTAYTRAALGYNGVGMTAEMQILVNGVSVATTGTLSDPGAGPHVWAPAFGITATTTVANGDEITTEWILGGHNSSPGSVPIAGVFAPPYQFAMYGDLS